MECDFENSAIVFYVLAARASMPMLNKYGELSGTSVVCELFWMWNLSRLFCVHRMKGMHIYSDLFFPRTYSKNVW